MSLTFRISAFVLVACSSAACASKPPPASAEPGTERESTRAGDGATEPGPPSADSGDVPDTTSPPREPTATGGSSENRDGSPPPESRSMDVIRKLVMDNRKPARQCYEDARKEEKDLRGDVVVHFVLDPGGKVKSAELNEERSTLKSKAVSACVISVIKGIAFPRSSRGLETNVNYPFNFTP